MLLQVVIITVLLTESVKSLLLQLSLALVVLTLLRLLLVVAKVGVYWAGLLVRCAAISTRVRDRGCLEGSHTWLVLHLLRVIVARKGDVCLLIGLRRVILSSFVRFAVLVANIASIVNKVGILEVLPRSTPTNCLGRSSLIYVLHASLRVL